MDCYNQSNQNKMIKSIINFFILLAFLASCNGQINSESRTLYNEEFKWTIVIPENFSQVSPSEWQRKQNKGAKAIEDTYGEEVINQTKIIFVFKYKIAPLYKNIVKEGIKI